MVGQWTLLVLVAAAAAGLVTVTVSALLVRSRRTAFFRYFLAQVLMFNLLILAGLVYRYAELQLGQRGVPLHPVLLPGLLAALAVLKLSWLYAFTAMVLVLPGQELPWRFGRRFALGAGVFFAIWTMLLTIGLATGSAGAVGCILATIEVVVVGGGAAGCGHLLLRATRLPAGRIRRSVTVLGSLYLAIFAVMVGSLVLGWLLPSGQTPSQALLNSSFLVVFNVLPLAWLLRYQPTAPLSGGGVADRCGFTPREREIIDLICAGSTNQEIADRLYISLATVKDHVYNVFRKTGVRNRVELVNLMRS